MGPRTLQVALLALIVVTAGCLGTVSPGTDSPGTDPGVDSDADSVTDPDADSVADADSAADADLVTDPDAGDGGTTIAVGATGIATADPDEAVVRIAVVARGDDPAAVRDDLAAGADALRDALADAGVEDVVTAGYSLHPDYRTEPDDPETYRGVHAFTVTVAPEEVGTVVDAAADAGATVQGVHFTLSEDARAEVRASALAGAMDQARAEADVVADAADLTVQGVRSASTNDVRYVPYAAEAGMDGGGSTTVEPGPVTVTATVQVTYGAA